MRVDQSVVNAMNKRNVINIIREKGPINKAEIARLVGLSIPTVMRLTDELIEKNLIRETGRGESTGGKPPLMLEFTSDSHYIIGVDIGTTHIKTIVMNMVAEIICRVETPTMVADPPEQVIDRILDTIARAMEKVEIPLSRYLGIGLGMPGLLDATCGKVLFSPDFKWENVDLTGPVKNRFGLPVYMSNVTRAMAVGEKWFGLAKDVENFMCVNLGYGIGAAIFINNCIYSGSSDSSGEFGHMTLEKNGPQCNCGNYGCLEALASANAMSKKAAFLIERGESSTILDLADGKTSNINAKLIFDAAKAGDGLGREIVREATEYIGIAISNAVNFIDPELIILEGGIAKAGDILINGIKRIVERRQMKYAGRKLSIVASKMEEDAAAIGAAAVLLGELVDNGGNLDKM
jgi:glucokinase-like ROK family protein